MEHTASKNPKINKDHNKQKMFRIGISVGRNDLNVEGHLQAGYSSKTIKNYKPIENASTNDEHYIQNDSIQNVEAKANPSFHV
jgi:hypothetical protein